MHVADSNSRNVNPYESSNKNPSQRWLGFFVFGDSMNFLERYNQSHQHKVNRACHAVGIPLVAVSIPLVIFQWQTALALFVVGWIFQFVGHAFEGKKPMFLENPLYLFVGLWWWLKKLVLWR